MFGEMWADRYLYLAAFLKLLWKSACFLKLEKSVYLSLEKDSLLATCKNEEEQIKWEVYCGLCLFCFEKHPKSTYFF